MSANVKPVTFCQNEMNDEQTSDKLQGAPYHTMTLEARVLQKNNNTNFLGL